MFHRILFVFLVNFAYRILLIIGWTSKRIYINYKIREDFAKKKIPIIYTFWHNRLLYLAYLYRKKGVGVMVSQHKDGDYIAGVMQKCKLKAVRGSTTRGGLRALIEIINYVKTGFDIAFTPDGPRGPRYEIQDGVFIAAIRTGFPIVPICWNAKYKKVFNSWDRFILPYPFNKFVVAYADPIYIKNKQEIPKKKKELQKSMMKLVDQVDHYKF